MARVSKPLEKHNETENDVDVVAGYIESVM